MKVYGDLSGERYTQGCSNFDIIEYIDCCNQVTWRRVDLVLD